MTLLQQVEGYGFNREHGLRAGRFDQRLGKQKSEVAGVTQLEGKRVGDAGFVGPVHRAARTHICKERTQREN